MLTTVNKAANLPHTIWHQMRGNSMKPMISNGDYIAMQELPDWKTYFPKGEVYALEMSNGTDTVKIIRKGSDDQHLKLVPVNTKDYDEDEISITAICRVFRVIGTIHKFY